MSQLRKPQSVVATSETGELESRPAEVVLPTAVDEVLEGVRASSQRAFDEVAGYTRSHPDKALLIAATAGYALRVLPVARILGGALRLAAPLVKPALLCYGLSMIIAPRRR